MKKKNAMRLHWAADANGATFWGEDARKKRIPVSGWGSFPVHTAQGKGSVGHLLGLMEDEIAKPEKNETIRLQYPDIASMDALVLEQLGLPRAAPYRLSIRGSGLLSFPGFSFQYQLIAPSGRPALGTKRTGTFIEAGSKSYTLLDPLFSLLEEMEAFNKTLQDDIDTRFLIWGSLQKKLPENAIVDDHLRSLNIVRADAFSLDYDENTSQIHPVLLTHTKKQEGTIEEKMEGEPLPPEAQKNFTKRFSDFSKAHVRYALEGGWYVVVGEPLQKALSVVKDYQNRPVSERKAFLDNPTGILKNRLQETIQEEQIETLFEETPEFLSQRIKGLGEWKPRLCAYVLPGNQEWLPPEEYLLGIPIGGSIVEVPVKEIPDLIQKVKSALANGEKEVSWNGQAVPVSEETLAQLQQLSGKEKTRQEEKQEEETPRSLIPIIIDNLETVGFQVQPRKVNGTVGGVPGNLKSDLFPHQAEGLKWLQEHWVKGSPGALLADDMGLGKTLQTLAFFAWLQEEMQAKTIPEKPFLIVAPSGLLKNWEDEAGVHLVSHGLGELFKAWGKDLKQLLGMTRQNQRKRMLQAGWVMTTYETLRDRVNSFTPVDWAVVAFDEAQKIKNPTTRTTEMAKSLKADFTLALTGTPVENRLSDLWSIMDATTPGFLGSLKQFHQTYEEPASQDPEAAAPLAKKMMEDSVPSIMLRRLKEDHISGLPEKKEWIRENNMPPVQAEAYEQVVASAARDNREKGFMLRIIQELRKVSLIGIPIGAEGMTDEVVNSSARLSAAMAILDGLYKKKEKALVFIEFIDILDALIPYLQARYHLSGPPMRISGKDTGAVRKKRVDAFQSIPPGEFGVMLLSPKAGGVGLTLTAANHVIHLNRWWNPAVEDQCTDRVYRIGQTRPVHIHLPLAVHPRYKDKSFDINLHSLLENKRRLSRSVLTPPELSDTDMKRLFEDTVHTGN